MTFLRRIRHSLVAFVASFLLVILFAPVGKPRTAWRMLDPAHRQTGQIVITDGPSDQPLVRRSKLPETLSARLQWQLSVTQQYADLDLKRGLRETNTEDSGGNLFDEDPAFRQVSHVQGDAVTGGIDDQTDSVSGQDAKSAAMQSHEFWVAQNQLAQDAIAAADASIKETVVAAPIAILPGQPSQGGILLATVWGLMAAMLIGGLEFVSVRFDQPSSGDDAASCLKLPATWIHETPAFPARVALALRRASIVVIAAIVVLAIFQLSDQSIVGVRLLHWPLAEVANLL